MSTSPAPRSGLRRFAIVASTGALLGFVLFCIFGPRVLGWWYTPPAKEAFSCGNSVAEALREFVKLQLGAALGGSVIVLGLVAGLRGLWSKITTKAPPAPEPALPAAPAPASPPASPPIPASEPPAGSKD